MTIHITTPDELSKFADAIFKHGGNLHAVIAEAEEKTCACGNVISERDEDECAGFDGFVCWECR